MKYVNGQSKNVRNDKPIIGQFGVNREGSGDMYYKGSLLLNTLRHVINNDDKWWSLLLKYAETYKKQIIDTPTVIAFFNQESGYNLTPIFNQYLNYTTLPQLEIKAQGTSFQYRWKTDEANFSMPIDIEIGSKKIRLEPSNDWKKSKEPISSLEEIKVLTDKFYIKTIK
jgi:aminopeptidase N